MRNTLGRLARFDVVDRWSGVLPPVSVQIVFGLGCTAGAMAVRLLVDLIVPAAGPYALVYPATLIATLFGRWQSGVVTCVSSLVWAWYFLLPHLSLFRLARPEDGPRTLVNLAMVLVVLMFADLFRAAVRAATVERDVAIASLQDRQARLNALNQDLEREVAERTRELGRTWDISPDLLGVLNLQGYFEKINPAWQTTLGWSAQHLAVTPFFEFVHPDDLERTNASWERVKRGEPVLRFDNRYRRTDGDWCWLSWVVVPEGDKLYCSARDITPEKQAAADLAATQEALRQAQKLEAIGQLTGGVAHDFNNLLTVIVGSVELLRRDDLSAERRRRHIEAIGQAADRAGKLTGQLLAFARRQTLRPEPFDVGASLEGVIGMVGALTGSRIELESRLPAEPCFVMADRSQFDTAIVNIAVNARDAMAGEGRIEIAAGAVSGIPARPGHPAIPGDFVAVTIADTGEGIAEEDFERIFEPFYTTKAVGAGTGLGLSQVIGFAKQSDGEVRVASTLGEGTVFTLYLPRVAAEPGPAVEEEDHGRDSASGEGVCVLVVEDNEQVGAFAANALAELGYESVLARDAAEALDSLAGDCGRYHVVFSDVVMPGMSGLDLGQRIRATYPDIPVILTSGYSHVLAQSGSHGFELLQKPYSIEQLSRVLRKARRPQSRGALRD